LLDIVGGMDGWDVDMQRFRDVDALFDRIDGLSGWQRRLLHSVAAARTPDDLWCHQSAPTQYRLGTSYQQLMEAHAIDVLRDDQ
jgi:hypothetical protein